MAEQLHVYRIRNKKTGEYLKRTNGKTIWHTKGAAKNAWNAEFSFRFGQLFAEQSKWECVEFRLLEVFR